MKTIKYKKSKNKLPKAKMMGVKDIDTDALEDFLRKHRINPPGSINLTSERHDQSQGMQAPSSNTNSTVNKTEQNPYAPLINNKLNIKSIYG